MIGLPLNVAVVLIAGALMLTLAALAAGWAHHQENNQ